jgi:hypothetical protein
VELRVSRQEIFAMKDDAAGRALVLPSLLMAMVVARQGVLGTVGPVALRTWVHAVGVDIYRKSVYKLFDLARSDAGSR